MLTELRVKLTGEGNKSNVTVVTCKAVTRLRNRIVLP